MRKYSAEKVLKETLIISFLILNCMISGPGQKPDHRLEDKLILQKCWTLEDSKLNSVASDNEFIYLSDLDGNLRQINSKNHIQLWISSIGNRIDTRLYFFNNKNILIGNSQNSENSNYSNQPNNLTVREINKITGITSWIRSITINGDYQTFYSSQSQSLLIVSDHLEMVSIFIENGKINWNYDNESKKIVTNDSSIIEKSEFYIRTATNETANVKIADDIKIQFLKTNGSEISAIGTFKNFIYYGDKYGNVYKNNSNSFNQNKILKAGGKITFLTQIGNDLLITSNDNFIYYYSTEKNKIKWKKRLPGRTIINPMLFKAKILITTITDSELYLFDITDGKLSISKNLYDSSIIRNILVNDNNILVHTNLGLNKLSSDCSK